MDQPPAQQQSRFRRFWRRHRRLFWSLHSVWALGTGIAVILIARERYGFVPWVVLFLILTWLSTLFFSRKVDEGEEDPGDAPDLRAEATSYVTRAMYQETLFFLLPFYAYSTVLWSPNVVFTGMLACLALVSCLDLLFDRWLRTKAVVSLLFFSLVTFAAINLLLPMLVPIDPTLATALAAGVAIASAIPLVLRGSVRGRREGMYLGVGAALFLAVALAAPQVVPPVPLRLEHATFSTDIDKGTLALPDTLAGEVPAEELDGVLVLLTEVFAPAIVPTHVSLVWERDGKTVHSSREIAIVAHDLGFRVWDSWRPDEGNVPPGDYTVYLRASRDRVFGMARIRVDGTSVPPTTTVRGSPERSDQLSTGLSGLFPYSSHEPS